MQGFKAGNASYMRDQAETLRREYNRIAPSTLKGITRVISFTSGKGGAGKSGTVVNTAIALARQGRSVLVLDADLGLANVDVLLGLKVEHTLFDVFNGSKTLREILVPGPEGIDIVPAASGVESICNLGSNQQILLLDAVEEIAADYEYLLIDTRAGISSDVMYFNSASSEIVCIVNPEPASLTDAYAMIKVLSRNYGEKSISILLNKVAGEAQALTTYRRLSRAVERFLASEDSQGVSVRLNYLGYIPADQSLKDAVQQQRAVVDVYPSSPSGLAFQSLARRIDTEFFDQRIKGGMQFFFRQLLEMSASGS